MKKIKKITTIALAVVTLFGASVLPTTKVKAIEAFNKIKEYIAAPLNTEFKHNAAVMLEAYAVESTTSGASALSNAYNVNNGVLVPLMHTDGGDNNFQNGFFDQRDQELIRYLGTGYYRSASLADYESQRAQWSKWAYYVQYSLAYYLTQNGVQTSADQVKVIVKSYTPAIEGINDSEIDNIITTDSGLTQDNFNKFMRQGEINEKVYEKYKDQLAGWHLNSVSQESVEVIAIAPNGAEYKLVNGTDKNWYLLSTQEAEIKLIYHTNGGTEIAPISFTIDPVEGVDKKITLSTTTRDGYGFIGWYIDSSLTKEFDLENYSEVIQKYTPTEENGKLIYTVDVYAKWESTTPEKLESTTTENPKTGITTSIIATAGTILLATIGYIAIKNKNKYNKI